jgi:hypothetical protein
MERSKNPNPTQIQSVLSVTPLFVSTLEIVYTNELDVFCIRNELGSLRMDVDLTLHREERRPAPKAGCPNDMVMDKYP